MKIKKITLILQAITVSLLISNNAFSENVTIIGSIEQTLKQSSTNQSSPYTANNKVIKLLHIQLSDEAKKRLQSLAQEALLHSNHFSSTASHDATLFLPNKVQLGMSNVPMLDQGPHGTCATFAVTGALDAVIGKKDYISQLCSLQLGNYLEMHGYGSSGWDGSSMSDIIYRIQQFGIVNKKKQHASGCGGLKHYPAYSSRTPKAHITPEKYRTMSELVFGKVVNWSNVYSSDPNKTLEQVKQALNNKSRLVFAVMLPRHDLGCVGAVGKHKTWIFKDTWVLTPDILKDVPNVNSAHAMIITGYDDNAVAVDNKGKKHKGLLILRNSWGRLVGDYGTFYMSYDYFKLLSYSVKQFSKPTI